ncbi:hypothetical protein GX48_00953 [Paracoccidioides brasiliensis]|nr:hypothetical protein GX48_00953 [Paracoccidioides brasiliensis]
MPLRTPIAPTIPLQRPLRARSIPQTISRQQFSTTPPPPPPPSHPNSSRLRTRLQTFNNRLPRLLRLYTTPLLNAPVTHVTSFLILHEITAVVPLLGLTGAFHYGGWIPSLGDGKVDEGVRKFGRWLRRKGWVGAEAEVEAETVIEMERDMKGKASEGRVGLVECRDRGVRLVLEFATAYAITKALLPVRVVLSVWATPWFARVLLEPVGKGVGKVFGKKG